MDWLIEILNKIIKMFPEGITLDGIYEILGQKETRLDILYAIGDLEDLVGYRIVPWYNIVYFFIKEDK